MVKQKIRKAHNDYLKEILDEALDNPKKFWQYVKNRKQTASGVAPLAQHDKLVVDGRGKAEVLSKQYDSIFTEEDLTKVPELGDSPYPDMPEVEEDNQSQERPAGITDCPMIEALSRGGVCYKLDIGN
ncbi:hypothetical protein Bbelb_164830 [Branchiostoma belcheri]|nr:hypothetical protein Bbelb_164830 [Branchiostoma belcheri]